MAYWLFKADPSAYSFADLWSEPGRTTGWDGVRNYQARNFLRDEVTLGDGVLFYHSSADPPCIAGIAEVVKTGHPDPTAFDPDDPHYDPKSKRDSPTWVQVSIRAVRAIEPPLALPLLNGVAGLKGMELLRKGSRLSIQPVTPGQWKTIMALCKPKKKK
jgi:predicted RNA-binding protein with PUA-like domain